MLGIIKEPVRTTYLVNNDIVLKSTVATLGYYMISKAQIVFLRPVVVIRTGEV